MIRQTQIHLNIPGLEGRIEFLVLREADSVEMFALILS